MEKAPWELLILCLMSLDTSSPHFQKEELQSLLDTGLSPKQGLLAYIRLLEQVRRRTELWEDVPDHMKIYDTELLI